MWDNTLFVCLYLFVCYWSYTCHFVQGLICKNKFKPFNLALTLSMNSFSEHIDFSKLCLLLWLIHTGTFNSIVSCGTMAVKAFLCFICWKLPSEILRCLMHNFFLHISFFYAYFNLLFFVDLGRLWWLNVNLLQTIFSWFMQSGILVVQCILSYWHPTMLFGMLSTVTSWYNFAYLSYGLAGGLMRPKPKNDTWINLVDQL